MRQTTSSLVPLCCPQCHSLRSCPYCEPAVSAMDARLPFLSGSGLGTGAQSPIQSSLRVSVMPAVRSRVVFVGVLAFCFVAAVAAAAEPRKPIWPRQFDVGFGLSVVPSNINGPIVNSTSHFYYNFDVLASLITYPDVCLPGLIPGEDWKKGCNLLFNPQGTYLFASRAGVDCCLLIPGVGTVPPDFLRGFNASGFVVPAPDLYGVLHQTNFWVTNEGFYYWTDAQSGTDISLVDGGSVMWNFYPKLRVAQQPKSLFTVPQGCSACPGSIVQHMKSQNYADPMIRLALHHHKLQQQ